MHSNKINEYIYSDQCKQNGKNNNYKNWYIVIRQTLLTMIFLWRSIQYIYKFYELRLCFKKIQNHKDLHYLFPNNLRKMKNLFWFDSGTLQQ